MVNRTLIGIATVILIGGLALGGYALSRDGGEPTPTVTDEPTATNEPSAEAPTSSDEPTTEAASSTLTDTATPRDTPVATTTATNTPQSASASTQEPATFTPIPTTQASPDVCSDHGGVQWLGETCVCPGKVDLVTICVDGTQFDSVTDRVCTPTTTCGSGDGGGSGGGDSGGDGELCWDGSQPIGGYCPPQE